MSVESAYGDDGVKERSYFCPVPLESLPPTEVWLEFSKKMSSESTDSVESTEETSDQQESSAQETQKALESGKKVVELFFKHQGGIHDSFPVRFKKAASANSSSANSQGDDNLDGESLDLVSNELKEDIAKWTLEASQALSPGGIKWKMPRVMEPDNEDVFLSKAQGLQGRLQEELGDEFIVQLRVRRVCIINLMDEYNQDWPLWPSNCHHEDHQHLMRARMPYLDLEYIDNDLECRLKKWATFFYENYHWDYGWKESTQAESHINEGKALAALLNEQLDEDPSTDWFVYYF